MANHMIYNPLQIRRIIHNMSFRQQSALMQPLTGEGRAHTATTFIPAFRAACTPLGEMRKEMADEKEEPKLPSVATLSSIIGGLMSQEIMKIILEIGKPLDNFLFYDGLTNAFTELQLAKNPSLSY